MISEATNQRTIYMTYLSSEIVGSVTAACASTIVGHPLDTIKVQLQTNPQLTSSLQAVRHIFHRTSHNQWILFRGISYPLANQILMNSVMFSVFSKVQSSSTLWGASDVVGSLGAGLASGVATAFVSTPTDYFKIQAQLATNETTGGSSVRTTLQQFIKQTTHTHGSRLYGFVRLYRGHGANLWREGIFTVVYLSGYDRILYSLRRQDTESSNHETIQPNYRHIVAVSSLTGALAWIASYPFDSMKSIIQAEVSGGRDMTMRRILVDRWKTNGGIMSLFRGCGASTFRAMLVTSVRMVMYEWTTSLVNDDL